jgi:type II secretory pathway component GspD/PulD (secretin)
MKKISFIFALIICLAISSFAQIKADNQCKYGEKDFVGEAIDLSLVNDSLRFFLSSIHEKYGCYFVVDKSIKELSVTISFEQTPWNIALDSILQIQGLVITRSNSTNSKMDIGVTNFETIVKDLDEFKLPTDNLDKKPIYTEFFRLKNNVTKDNNETYIKTVLDKIKLCLSKRGTVEIDSAESVVIVTDIREVIDYLRESIILTNDGKIENEYKKENP